MIALLNPALFYGRDNLTGIILNYNQNDKHYKVVAYAEETRISIESNIL